MQKKIAVAIIHGIGNQEEDFAEKTIKMIKKQFNKKLNQYHSVHEEQLIIEPIHWAPILIDHGNELYNDLVVKQHLNYKLLRKFTIHSLGDAIAYQPMKEVANDTYMKIHKRISETLNQLSEKAGSDAPLCVVSHSLGSVISSNFFYDLQQNNNDLVINRDSQLERGKTLTLFYTLGTPLSLWSLRYRDFEQPINIPNKEISKIYPDLKGEWINFYSKNDALAYPLKPINKAYHNAVTEDRVVRTGNLFTCWNPLCHTSYFKNKKVINTITDGLVSTWKQINSIQ